MAWDEEYDTVSVGSGIGGLSAAITAAEHGAKALVLEKFELLGGVSALSSGQLFPGPNHLAEAAGIEDRPEMARQYIDHLGQGQAMPEIRDEYLSGSRECLLFFDKIIGIPMQVIQGLPDYYYPSVPGSAPEGRYVEVRPFAASQLGDYQKKVLISPYGLYYSYSTSSEWVEMQQGGESLRSCIQRHVTNDERCAGAGMAAAQVLAALNRGVNLRTSTEVIELITDDNDGRVIGVVARDRAGTHRIRARRGVILATGGYDWNKPFVRRFDGLPDTGSMALPTVTGDHIVLASKLGVIPMPSRVPSQSPIFVGYKVPTELIYGIKPSYRLLVPGQPHSMIVNRKGKRFSNDSFYPDVVTKAARFDGQEDGMVNWPAWLVFDQRMLDRKGLLPVLAGQPLLEGMASSAQSLSELANEIGIDGNGLQQTVERFNCMCSNGVDEDFQRGINPWGRLMAGDPKLKNPNMAPVSQPPFYAVRLERVTMGVPTAGLPTDQNGRVKNAAGDVIDGLYAVGNSSAWMDWGGGFNSGIAGMRGLLYGYRAALHMTAF
ncbi:fumarate reductase/succinate dehydrogenase flavoprotein-like protein [Talaromyces proteolyticus]|uniref:Fumarate reductase/succinate dehydrogenase flavoprotein-like protein n=1 Tax=Talaromyces proteolyticus TaxID=1131652 RepID=A0AAD4Q0T0_9EURO|nr:fumarate reductase/succinate dehydrogenase flavoprotein-like protein [Talaromyces proteolyticus]KAH8701509.1 fumarate reductase/succinate dehydrogenase flavoprotein-like protein [Talaromyces proteolyticus]